MINESEIKEEVTARQTPEIQADTNEAVTSEGKIERIKFGELTLFSKVAFCVILVLCIGLGVSVGVSMHYQTIIAQQKTQIESQAVSIDLLEKEKSVLQENIAGLEDTVRIMSETIASKNQSEENLDTEFKKLFIPTEFPLTGAASMDVVTEGEPACIITAGEDAMVVASAGGTISAIEDDGEYLHCIRVDHGNGYVSVYKNSGDVKVKQGETINKGNTLFCIGSAGSKVYFQIYLNDEPINPMDVLIING